MKSVEEDIRLKVVSGISSLITYCGDDPTRPGMLQTPDRIAKAYREMTVGYEQDPEEILSTRFAAEYDEMVILRGIAFSSLCEHHLLPFTGIAAIGYLPNAQVVGISKLARLVDCYARRFQIQENMTLQIATAIMKYLKPKGVAVHIIATHQCMACRGANKPGAEMVTTCLLGAFRSDEKTRSEFLRLVPKE